MGAYYAFSLAYIWMDPQFQNPLYLSKGHSLIIDTSLGNTQYISVTSISY